MSTTEVGRRPTSGKPDSTNRDGVSLQAVIESDRRLDELSCARLLGSVAELVHAAQKAGQPLGTITPASIVVLPDGSAKLAPGAASPRYTAPERLRGGTGDRRTDVFSLGVVLWEVLAHERLFDGSDDDAVKRAVLERAVRPPSELNANVPAELDAICKRALARDPADRYQSARVMAAEIDAVLGDAGYPESNQQIAAYLARAFAAPEPTAERPPAPASRSAPTLPPPPLKPPLPTTTILGNAPGTLRSSTMPPPTSAAPAIAPGSSTKPPLTAAAPATAVAGSIPAPAGPSPFAPAVPENTLPGSAPPPATRPPPFRPTPPPSSMTAPFGSQALSPGVIEPAFKPVALPASAPAKFAKTEVLGSAVPPPVPSASPPSMPAMPPPTVPPPIPSSAAGPHPALPLASGPPAMPVSHAPPAMPISTSPPAMPTSTAGPHPALPPARMEAPPMLAQVAIEAKLPAPGATAHPQPPRSIANAETLATPQLPAHLSAPPTPPPGASPLGGPGLGGPPASAPPSHHDTEVDAFNPEHRADPAAVIAPHTPEASTSSGVREGRDVLAGWGWSTGSVQALDDDITEDALRRGRRNLLIAIGGALGVVIIIAIVAFAFSGSKKPDDQGGHGTLARPPSAPVAATPETPTQPAQTPPSDPNAATTAEPARTEPPPPPPTTASADSPTTAAPAPSPGPGAVVPPRFDSAKPEPPPAEPWKPEPPKAEAPKAEPPKAEPPKAEPPKPEPPKAEAKVAALPKTPPPKPEPAKAVEAKKPPELKKPPEKAPEKLPEKTVKRPPAPEKIAKANPRAQPVDPYAAESHKVDPAAAYRTGLQQYAHGDTAGALATFRGSLATNPGFAPTWRGIGLVYEKMGNKGQARAAFKRYLQLAPTAGDADQIRDRMERLGS